MKRAVVVVSGACAAWVAVACNAGPPCQPISGDQCATDGGVSFETGTDGGSIDSGFDSGVAVADASVADAP
jgi:hypothetical protein